MREIEFRGKRIDNGKWAYGGFTPDAEDQPRITVKDGERLSFPKVIPETVGQYAGVKDRKGAKVFEGDVVSWFRRFGNGDLDGKRRVSVVTFYGGGFALDHEYTSLGYYSHSLLEIIGNVHDDPELLKGGGGDGSVLNERTLFGERNKVELSLARIKEFEPMALRLDPAGYYVCVSGGKDSSVIQELCIMAGVRCEFVHNHTSVDHPETVRFVRSEKRRLENMGRIFRIEIPRFADGRQKTMWNLIERKGLPLRTVRWRCDELKEGGGEGRYVMTGVRWEESPRRRRERALHEVKSRKKEGRVMLNNDNDMRRRMSELCERKKAFVLNPIIDWTESEVWEFIKSRSLPYNPLYDMGYKRVGCVGCPMSSKVKKELDGLPKYKAAYFRAVEKYVAYRRESGRDCSGAWETAEEYFDWWIKKGRGCSGADQKELIEE